MTKLTTRQRDKLIEAAQTAIEFTVLGTGEFPFDMLRHDRAWPATESDARKLESPGYGREAINYRNVERAIKLRGLVGPTVARWASFGWTAVPS
jgi:hypothetical protein